jgi:hypothetical protein
MRRMDEGYLEQDYYRNRRLRIGLEDGRSEIKSDSILANKCLDRSSSLQDEINKFLEGAMTRRGKVAVGLAFAAESVSRACGYSSDIAETAINLAEGQ